MQKIYLWALKIILIMSLTACGGGGEGGDDPKPPTDPITPPTTNTAPSLTISKAQVELKEKTSETVSFVGKDSNGDSLSYLVDSNNIAVSAHIAGSAVIITANEVENDVAAIVKITVSDGKATAVKNISVKVLNDIVIVNNPPVLTLASTYTMSESSTGVVPFSATDPEGEPLSYSVKSSNSYVSASIVGNDVNLVSSAVNIDSMSTVEVSVTDGVNTVTKSFTVKVVESGDYVPFSLYWEDAINTNLYTAKGAQGKIKVNLQEGSVPLNLLTYTVNMTPSISATFDVDSGEVVISTSYKDETTVYSGIFTVSDGVTSQNLTFSMDLQNQTSNTLLDNDHDVFLEEGETKTFSLIASSSIDPSSLRIYELQPINIISGDYSKFNFTYDNNAKTYSLTALAGSKFSKLQLNILTTDDTGSVSGGVYTVYSKGAATALELDLEEKTVLALKYLKQSKEFEILGNFLIDALEMKGTDPLYSDNSMTREEAFSEKLLIADAQFFTATESSPELECILNATQRGFVINHTFKYIIDNGNIFTQTGYICSYGDTEVFNDLNLNKKINFYEDMSNYTNALSVIDKIKSKESQKFEFVKGITITDRINSYAKRLHNIDPKFNLGYIDFSPINDLGNNVYSRFIGNPNYGSYVNNEWIWLPEYELLDFAATLANEITNW